MPQTVRFLLLVLITTRPLRAFTAKKYKQALFESQRLKSYMITYAYLHITISFNIVLKKNLYCPYYLGEHCKAVRNTSMKSYLPTGSSVNTDE